MYAFTTIVAALGLVITTLAAPAAEPGFPGFPRANKGAELSSLQQPSNTLPTPDGLTLKYLALGIGTQNYSCAASASSSSAPVAVGAVAQLYDLSGLMKLPSDMVQKVLPTIPGMALSFSGAAKAAKGRLPSQISGMGVQAQPFGNHFFTSAAVPTFDLTSAIPEAQMNGKKLAVMNAPAGSCPGLSNEGAVPWLYLGDNGGSINCQAVYRLETAGGSSAKTCAGIGGDGTDGHVEVPYAAEYWFYG